MFGPCDVYYFGSRRDVFGRWCCVYYLRRVYSGHDIWCKFGSQCMYLGCVIYICGGFIFGWSEKNETNALSCGDQSSS